MYAIEITRISGDIVTIFETYSDFFDLHLQLLSFFPEEAGININQLLSKKDAPSIKRIIPELPSNIVYVTDSVARGRLPILENYISTILNLPAKISKSPVIMTFLKTDGKKADEIIKKLK